MKCYLPLNIMMNIIRRDENCIFRYFPLFSEFARELTHPVSCVSKGHSPFHWFLDARINISKVYKFNEFPKSMEFYENVVVFFHILNFFCGLINWFWECALSSILFGRPINDIFLTVISWPTLHFNGKFNVSSSIWNIISSFIWIMNLVRAD